MLYLAMLEEKKLNGAVRDWDLLQNLNGSFLASVTLGHINQLSVLFLHNPV